MSKGIHVDLTGSDDTVKNAYRHIATSGHQGLGRVGKGDAPRNCFSNDFRKNYDNINWHLSSPIGVADFKKALEASLEAALWNQEINAKTK